MTRTTMLAIVITKKCSTRFGDFEPGEVVEAPYDIAEWLVRNKGVAYMARTHRWPGEKKAPVPVATRVI